VQEVGKGSREREQNTVHVGNKPCLQAYPTRDESVPRLENPKVDPQTQGDQQAEKVDVKGGERRARGCRS
jgi:hypothetical protein